MCGGILFSIRKFTSKFGHLIDDMMGEPERPGVPRRPGWGERIARLDDGNLHIIGQVNDLGSRVGHIEAEFRPDSGKSLRDRIDGIESHLCDGTEKN